MGVIMVDLCHKYEEPQHKSEHTHEELIDSIQRYFLLTRDRKSICRVECSNSSIAIPQILEITKFIKEEQVPSGLHCTVIHPAYEDKRQKLEWGNFLRFMKEYKRAAFAKTENGEMYIIPPSQDEEYSHAMVQYMMPDCFSRTQCHVKSDIKHEYDGFQVKLPKIGFEDNQPLKTIVENRNRSLSSAKGQTLLTKNYVSAHPSYLRTLGQTHSDWLFGAVAELVDNSRDAKATMLDISVDMIYSSIAGKEIPMLAVVDDGHGMGHDEILKMVSFGRKQPDTNDPDYIGRYGVGFKTGTMRLGRDALVLTQTSNSRSIAFLSQSLNEGKDNIEIPIVSYSRKGQLMDFDTSIQTAASAENNLKSIEEFSPFNKYFIGEKAGLFQRNGTGTQIYVWNLDEWGSEYALEWVNGMSGGSSFHQGDILIRSRRTRSRLGQMTRQVPIDYSLRSYLEVIFLDPRMKIKVQGSLVKSRPLARFLHKTSIENGFVLGKQVQLVLGHSQPDLEQGNCGIFLYWHGRLIEAYKRVGSMIHNGEKSHGILGVIDVTGVMDDGNNHVWVHNNKQGFVDCEPYALLEDWLSKKVDEYLDNTIDKVYVKKGGPRHKPDNEWVQCNKCRKWRMLDPDFDCKTLPLEWFCYMKPINGKCEMPEQKVEPGVITISSRRSGYDTKENSPNQNNQLKSKQEEGEINDQPLKRLKRLRKRQ